MHSIRFKIMAIMIAAILTTILVLGGMGIVNISKESDRSSVERMEMICDNLTQKLNSYYSSLQQSVDMGIHLAEDSLSELDMSLFSTGRTEEEQQRLDTILTDHCAEIEHAFSSIASNTNGIVTYYYCINADLGSSQHGFFWSRLGNETFVRQDPLISTDLDIKDTEHTGWYYVPLKNGHPSWVGPYKAHYLNEVLTLSYVAPVYRYGFLIGVLGMDILFDTIIDHVKALQVYGSGFAFLMEYDGTILYHPFIAQGTTMNQLAQMSLDEQFKRLSSGSQMIRYNLNGVEKQLSFSTLLNRTKLGITVPVSEITENKRKVIVIVLVSAAGLMVIFGLITLLLVNAVTRPLLNLASASRQLMDGNYDVELDYQGKDEVGVVTRSFCRMRDHMKMYISDLNSRAYRDAMTGIRNKGAFENYLARLNDEIGKKDPDHPTAFAIAVFDCNDLKHINDSFGHDRGDDYLKTACSLICRVFTHSPVFRLGGDEFGVLLQNTDYENRNHLMEEFDRLAALQNGKTRKPWQKVNISKGMAVYTPGLDESASDTVTRADQLMYEDKKRYHA